MHALRKAAMRGNHIWAGGEVPSSFPVPPGGDEAEACGFVPSAQKGVRWSRSCMHKRGILLARGKKQGRAG